MLKVNEYFDGQVKSISFENERGHFTIGVMEPGEYKFSTSTKEYMQVISGEMTILLPEHEHWERYVTGQEFIVEKNSSFNVKINVQTAYLCKYEQ